MRTGPSTAAQRRAIKIAQKRRGLDDETYRDLLETRYGVRSCTDLSNAEAHALLNILYGRRAPAGRPKPRRARPAPAPPGVVRLVTPAQTRLIAALAGEVAWREEDGYRLWLAVNQGLERVSTSAQAARVIEGLRALKRRGRRDA